MKWDENVMAIRCIAKPQSVSMHRNGNVKKFSGKIVGWHVAVSRVKLTVFDGKLVQSNITTKSKHYTDLIKMKQKVVTLHR